ncbi:MAG: 3-hydroxyisobutyrate dehydrogenase [Acidobacteriota bacterium]|jgi:3-hydroxyisobutyrate dehydrogenase|nr:3-hydroxyisobutyrate dehydrogenase [Acidobacteriota bacterium]
MKIGFIGLGAMGYPMARHLAKEHEVLVWNRTREKAERHAREHGTRLATDLADVASAEVIITILPTSKEVDEIVDQLLDHVKPGTLWIDATSGDPNVSRETAKRLAERGVEFVDAPVTGAVVGAENATLTIMIGGTAENFARAKEVLRLNGKTLIHVGDVGAGHAIKVLTNSIMGATVWITAECLLLAKQLGIDMKTALEVTNAGSGRSNASENLLPLRLRDGQWPLVFKLAHHDKDIRIAASLAHQQHASTPLLALTSQLFTASLKQLGENADYIEVAKIVAKMNGTTWD